MAIDEFWYNVRRAAAGVYRPDVYAADEPLPTPEEVEARLRADTRWFRTSTVAGFSEGAFARFLTAGELTQLTGGVTDLRSAVVVNDLAGGVAAFAAVLDVVNFYRYLDPDGLRYGKRIEQRLRERGWPDHLRELRFWRATREEDFPMLNIYAHLRENRLKTVARFLEACRELRPILDEVADEVAGEWFPHITFRTDDLLAEYANQPDEDDDPPAETRAPAMPAPGAA